jgi:hypothetical protein
MAAAKKRRSGGREPAQYLSLEDPESCLAFDWFPDIRPDGDGVMPISAAIHWIASEGRKINHDLLSAEGKAHYSSTASALFGKVVSGTVRVIGENENEENDFMPVAEFGALKAYFDFSNDDIFEASAGNDKRLEVNVSGENDESRDVFRKPTKRGEWTKLYVLREEIRREWPEETTAPPKISPQTTSESGGAPETFKPYPEIELSGKPKVACEIMQLLWTSGPPERLSSLAMAGKVTTKYQKLGWSRVDGRGHTIKDFSAEDIQRALGRRKK